jgi:predicted enzyme related to lactoylglutathione lyase
MAAAGHRVLEPPHRTGELGRYESVVLDPDGNRLKLTV